MPKPLFKNTLLSLEINAKAEAWQSKKHDSKINCSLDSTRSHHYEIAEIIRVDHAGEYGAQRIYQGQIRFAKNKEDKRVLLQMLEHEEEHLNYFAKLIKTKRIRPTMLLGFWHHIGYTLGAISSICGINNAMLLTQNVEEVIEKHYKTQIKILSLQVENESTDSTIHESQLFINKFRDDIVFAKDLAHNITNFMNDEILHKTIAKNYNTELNLGKRIAAAFIKRFCSLAIFLSRKI